MYKIIEKIGQFKCGETVWFRDNRTFAKNQQVRSGIINEVRLTERYERYQYNVEVRFDEYDWFKNDGSLMNSGIYLVHTEKEKRIFKSLEELQEWESNKSKKVLEIN